MFWFVKYIFIKLTNELAVDFSIFIFNSSGISDGLGSHKKENSGF